MNLLRKTSPRAVNLFKDVLTATVPAWCLKIYPQWLPQLDASDSSCCRILFLLEDIVKMAVLRVDDIHISIVPANRGSSLYEVLCLMQTILYSRNWSITVHWNAILNTCEIQWNSSPFILEIKFQFQMDSCQWLQSITPYYIFLFICMHI